MAFEVFTPEIETMNSFELSRVGKKKGSLPSRHRFRGFFFYGSSVDVRPYKEPCQQGSNSRRNPGKPGYQGTCSATGKYTSQDPFSRKFES
jgi:hypothetical protein